MTSPRIDDAVPRTSLLFGYGPMLPFAAAAIGAWTLPFPWPGIAIELAILWGALILAFGAPGTSTGRAIATMLGYFVPAGLALVLSSFGARLPALALLLLAYLLVIVLDRRAALTSNAPAHFARLRPPQMAIAVIALAALLARMLLGP